MSRVRGFTIVELGVVLVLFVLLVTLFLILAGISRRSTGGSWQIHNMTQLRGIQQGMVIFAQSNKAGSEMGWYPGVSRDGVIEQTDPGAKLKILLDANAFTPDFIIHPWDTDKQPWQEGDGELTTDHYSYAMLRVEDVERDKGRYMEWRETINTSAVVLSDRNTKTGDARGSIWTDGEMDWRGTVVRNDNSTSFESSHIIEDTQYHDGERNEQDDLFAAEGAFDAMMTYGKPAENTPQP